MTNKNEMMLITMEQVNAGGFWTPNCGHKQQAIVESNPQYFEAVKTTATGSLYELTDAGRRRMEKLEAQIHA